MEFAYLLGSFVFLVVWLGFYKLYPSTRKEMLIVSLGVGLLSVATSYYWWTQDWWHPLTITGTRVGIEDFLTGFGSGGIMAVAYEGIFKRKYFRRKLRNHHPGAATLLLLMAFSTAWLFWGVGITSFWASVVSLLLIAGIMFFYRRDLFANGVASGLIVMVIATLPYYAIQFFSPDWVSATYHYEKLSGVHITGIPIEELVFWFLAGLVFGPFYEYWQGQRLGKKDRF